jgi:replicative DNA helicase
MRPVELAESALLGALLVDPSRVDELYWLDPADFSEGGRAAIFDELRRQVAGGTAVDAMSIADGLRCRTDVHHDLVSTVRLHDMIASTVDGDVGLYGRMVLEAAIRRQVRGLGVEVSAAPLGEHELASARTVDAAERVLSSVENLRERWDGGLCRAESDWPRLAAARQIAQVEPPSRDAVAVAERRLIAAAITGPSVTRLVERFGPDDFAERATSATWRAVATLSDCGKPVNVVTVAWEQQRGRRQFGPGLPVDELRELARVPPLGIDSDADVVAAARLHRVASDATHNLAAAANHTSLALEDVLTTTRVSINAVRRLAERIKAVDPSTGTAAVHTLAPGACPARRR